MLWIEISSSVVLKIEGILVSKNYIMHEWASVTNLHLICFMYFSMSEIRALL